LPSYIWDLPAILSVPSSAVVVPSVINVGRGDPYGRGFPECKVELERLAAEDRGARAVRL
jgi:hypothetical protein